MIGCTGASPVHSHRPHRWAPQVLHWVEGLVDRVHRRKPSAPSLSTPVGTAGASPVEKVSLIGCTGASLVQPHRTTPVGTAGASPGGGSRGFVRGASLGVPSPATSAGTAGAALCGRFSLTRRIPSVSSGAPCVSVINLMTTEGTPACTTLAYRRSSYQC